MVNKVQIVFGHDWQEPELQPVYMLALKQVPIVDLYIVALFYYTSFISILLEVRDDFASLCG